MFTRRRWTVAMVAAVVLVPTPVAPSTTGASPLPAACVETPRPGPGLPALVAQEQLFGFHDEELVLCSPGAPDGGQPVNLSARLWVPAGCGAGGCPGVLVVHGFGGTKET